MNARIAIALLALPALVLAASLTADAQKLGGVVGHNLSQIGPRLHKAEKLLTQGDPNNALAYYNTAKAQWDAVHKDYKGKFDVKHPDIVAMQKRFDAIAAKIAAAGKATAKPENVPAQGTPGDSGVKAPPAAMLYVMKQINASLDGAEQEIAAKRLEGARDSFKNAEQQWSAQQQWNKGKYDPRHPTVIALAAKYERVKTALAGLGSESATAAKNLPAVLDAINASQKQLDVAYQQARSSFRDVSSLMSDFDSGREQNVDKLRIKIDELQLRAERVDSLLPDALAAARAFRSQYPDFSKLKKLVRNGRQAGQAVERLEKFPQNWLADAKRLIDEALGYADENIKQFGLDKLSAINGGDATRQQLAADSAEQWVLQYSAFLLDVIPSILPELPPEARTTLPEFAAARQEFEKRAEPMRAKIKQVAKAVAGTRKNVADAQRRRLESARFPKTTHATGAAEGDIRRAWAAAIKDKKLLKISIYRPYEVRTEARWRKDHWVVTTYRYVGTNCLAELPSGKYLVYRMTFRNIRQADGSWGTLEHRGVGHVFEIQKENLDK